MALVSAKTDRSFWWIIAPSAIVVLLAVIGGCIWWRWSINPENLPVTNVKITNSYQKVTREELQKTIEPFLHYGFMTLPLADLQAALEQLTWVNKVSVRRIWPDTIEIFIQEQIASARWGYGGVLNAEGILFNPDQQSIASNLPLLMGPGEMSQAIFQHYQLLQALLAPSQLKIISVQVSPRHSWQIQLDNHMVVVLGPKQHRERLQRFVKVLPKLQGKLKGKIHQVDLRYPNGLAVS